ncbi:hypothetical protein FO519_001821, partial [Halicephalobus sp. NKZ332]
MVTTARKTLYGLMVSKVIKLSMMGNDQIKTIGISSIFGEELVNPNMTRLDLNNLEKQLLQWKKKYGNVITIWIPDPQIVVGDAEAMKEFIKHSEAYAGRPTLNVMKLILGGNYGLVFNDDSFWKSQRRFAIHVLKDFGFGKPVLEETIIDQANQMIKFLGELNGKPIDMKKILNTAIGNVIHQLTFGWTVPLDSDYIMDFHIKMIEVTAFFVHPMGLLCEIWDGFRILDPLFNRVMKKALDKNDAIVENMKKEIKKHRETIDYNSDPKDYIDAFLIEQRRQKAEDKLDGEWSDKQLIAAIYDLFSAGMETTASSTRAFILYMINYPEAQKKIHEEIDREIGRDRNITMSDQVKLPYLQACIQELQRIAVLLVVNAQHRTTEDVIIDGYRLPKGTTIIPQFQSVHLDEDHFCDPERFDPTRHLDKENRFSKNDKVTPFSLGKRSCLGES